MLLSVVENEGRNGVASECAVVFGLEFQVKTVTLVVVRVLVILNVGGRCRSSEKENFVRVLGVSADLIPLRIPRFDTALAMCIVVGYGSRNAQSPGQVIHRMSQPDRRADVCRPGVEQ